MSASSLPSVLPTGPSAVDHRPAPASVHHDVAVIVPTRNESANVAVLVDRVAAAMAEPAGPRCEILFVDDSDDDTPASIRALAHGPVSVRLLHRPSGFRPGGLSGAVVSGIANTTSDVIVVMDGDLQHPPEMIAALVEPILAGRADVTVASRYIDGGGAVGLDGDFRRAVSNATATVSRSIFPALREVSDPGSGFFALRRSVVDDVDLQPIGFKILLEILVRGSWDAVEEVPFLFGERLAGASKANIRQGVTFARHLSQLWLRDAAPDRTDLARFVSREPAASSDDGFRPSASGNAYAFWAHAVSVRLASRGPVVSIGDAA